MAVLTDFLMADSTAAMMASYLAASKVLKKAVWTVDSRVIHLVRATAETRAADSAELRARMMAVQMVYLKAS